MSRRKPLIVFAVAAAVVALDAATKAIAASSLSGRQPIEVLGGLIRLGFYRNFAGPNDILPGQTLAISIFAIVAAIVLVVIAFRLTTTLAAVAVGLLLGGAVGNLLDRLLREPSPLHGGVVDWLRFTGATNWMNLADLAIDAAIVTLFIGALLGLRRPDQPSDRPDPAAE